MVGDTSFVAAAMVEALAARATEAVESRIAAWRPDDEFIHSVAFKLIRNQSLLSGAGNEGQKLSHLQPINIEKY